MTKDDAPTTPPHSPDGMAGSGIGGTPIAGVQLSSKTAIEYTKMRQREAEEAKRNPKPLRETVLKHPLFGWKNTILPTIFLRPEVWIFTLFHLMLFIIDQLYREHILDPTPDPVPFVRNGSFFVSLSVGFMFIGPSSWLMVIVLALFLAQCYTRYLDYCKWCTDMQSKLVEITQKLAVDFETLTEDRWDVVRFLTSSTLMVYGATQRGSGPAAIHKELFWKRLLSTEAEFLGHTITTGDGIELKCPALLSDVEVEILKNYRGNRGTLLQMWALKAAVTGYEKLGISRCKCPVSEAIQAIHRDGQLILDRISLPVPFAYYHIVHLLTVFNYFLYSYAYLNMDSYLSPVCMLVTVAVLSGTRNLAARLADPFGEDGWDLPVMKFMTNIRSATPPIITHFPFYPTAVSSNTEAIKKLA